MVSCSVRDAVRRHCEVHAGLQEHIGGNDLSDVLGSKEWREAVLPEVVNAPQK